MIDKDKVLEAMARAHWEADGMEVVQCPFNDLHVITKENLIRAMGESLKAAAKALPGCETSLDKAIFYNLIKQWGKDD